MFHSLAADAVTKEVNARGGAKNIGVRNKVAQDLYDALDDEGKERVLEECRLRLRKELADYKIELEGKPSDDPADWNM